MIDAPGLLAAVGGRDNVVEFGAFAGRLLFHIVRAERVDESALRRLGIRGLARTAADRLQVLVAGADNWDEPLRRLL